MNSTLGEFWLSRPFRPSCRRGGRARRRGRRSCPCVRGGWMIVLEGATSQWKRAGLGRAAIGPPARSPAAIRAIASRCARTVGASASGARACKRRSSRSTRAARNRRGRQNRITPAFMDSPALHPRHHADDRVLEGMLLSHAQHRPCSLPAPAPARPPARRHAAPPAAGSGSPRRRAAARLACGSPGG